MAYLTGLAISGVFAYACYSIAESKKRSGVLWGIMGFLFSVIALLIIALLPKIKRRGNKK